MMNTFEIKELNQPLSILQRLDRLELLALFLERKHSYTTGKQHSVDKCLKEEEEEECKSLSYAFQEVHHKGTLLERITLLENRVIQLSMELELELGNTSRSSSSTSSETKKLGEGSGLLDSNVDSIVKEACSLNSPSCGAHGRSTKAMSRISYNRKWLKCLKLGC